MSPSTSWWSPPASGPQLDFLRELRLALDPALECPPELAPLIDPNEHSCGTVRPHGARELAQPEPGFYFAGMKSYGRAPTFLMLTGYEQVRSIAAEIAGDHEAAAQGRAGAAGNRRLQRAGSAVGRSAGKRRAVIRVAGRRLLRWAGAGRGGGLLQGRRRGQGRRPDRLRLRLIGQDAHTGLLSIAGDAGMACCIDFHFD